MDVWRYLSDLSMYEEKQWHANNLVRKRGLSNANFIDL